MELKVLNFLIDLKEVRQQMADLRFDTAAGIDLGDIQTGYETAIEDLLEIAGLTDRQIDLIWEMTEFELN